MHASRIRGHAVDVAERSLIGRWPLQTSEWLRVALSGLIVLVCCSGCTDDAVRPPQQLREILSGYRPFVARLTDGGPQRDCSAVEPLCDAEPADYDSLHHALIRLTDVGDGQIDRLHAAGMAALVEAAVGEDTRQGVEWLRQAADAAPEDARFASDLAASLLVQGQMENDLDVVLRGLREADRALGLQPRLVEALFNRALALSWIPLPHQAVQAWDRVLEVERDEAWRQEARARQRAMNELLARGREPEVVARCRAAAEGGDPEATVGDVGGEVQQVRLYVEDELLPLWGEAVESGDDAAAARRLAVASYLVDAVESAGGDALLLRLASRAIVQATESGGPVLRDLARGHRLYGAARAAYERLDYETAGGSFGQAARLLGSADSPFVLWSRYYLAVLEHFRPDYRACLDSLRRLRRSIPDGDRVLTAYSEWMIGLTLSKQAYLEEALQRFRHGRELFVATGEVENISAMDSQAALKWEDLGRLDEAWRLHRSALGARERQYKSRRIQNAVSGAGETLMRLERTATALYFFDEWVAEAEGSGNAVSEALALTGRARALLACGESRRAAADLGRAETSLLRVTNPGLRLETGADVDVARAALAEADDPATADAALRRAQEFLVEANLRLDLVDVLLARARLYGRLGAVEEQGAQLTAAVDEVERQRGLIRNDSKRVSFLDHARHVMEEAVAFYLDAGRPEEAFLLSEQMRSPVLREEHRRRGIGGKLRALDQVQRELGDGTTVLSYLLLGDRLVRWEVSRYGLEVLEQRGVDRDRLDGEVGSFVTSVREGSIDRGTPLGPRLLPDSLAARQDAHLLVVPDGPLHALPFGALPVRGDAGLVADHAAVVLAPSVNVSLDLAAQRRRLAAMGEPTILVVTDFEHDRQAYPELPSLLGGSEDLEGLFPGRKITFLIGPQATRERFLAMFGRFTTVYFGGHGIVRGRYLGGALLLAPDGRDDDGMLSHEDLLRVDSGDLRTQVVFLAACNTGVGELSGTEGPMSAAQPFLAIGVPTVYASLWPITGQGVGWKRVRTKDPKRGFVAQAYGMLSFRP